MTEEEERLKENLTSHPLDKWRICQGGCSGVHKVMGLLATTPLYVCHKCIVEWEAAGKMR